MSDYVNKVKKDNVEYDINDARLSDETVEALSQLLSQISYEKYVGVKFNSNVVLNGVNLDMEYDETHLFLQSLAQIINGDEEQLIPLTNNAGKVLAVNEDENGLIAVEKGTKLYKHTLSIIADGETIVIINDNPTPISANSVDLAINTALKVYVSSDGNAAIVSAMSLGAGSFYTCQILFSGDGTSCSLASVSYDTSDGVGDEVEPL